MNNEGEMIGKETIVAYWKDYSDIFLEGLKKTTEALRIAGIHAEIRTEDQI